MILAMFLEINSHLITLMKWVGAPLIILLFFSIALYFILELLEIVDYFMFSRDFEDLIYVLANFAIAALWVFVTYLAVDFFYLN